MNLTGSYISKFKFIVERVWKRLSSWKEKLLSVAAKGVLIKSVIQAIPRYVMQCFLLPKGGMLFVDQRM